MSLNTHKQSHKWLFGYCIFFRYALFADTEQMCSLRDGILVPDGGMDDSGGLATDQLNGAYEQHVASYLVVMNPLLSRVKEVSVAPRTGSKCSPTMLESQPRHNQQPKWSLWS